MQGQRIYHITQQNMATVLPNIHHDPLVMDEIKSALAAGKEVTTHADDVSVPGWTGAGYIIMDPHTGIGAYKIGGGENGGYVGLVYGATAAYAVLALGLAITSKSGPASALTAAMLGQVMIMAYAVYELYAAIYGEEVAWCFAKGFVVGFETMATAIALSLAPSTGPGAARVSAAIGVVVDGVARSFGSENCPADILGR